MIVNYWGRFTWLGFFCQGSSKVLPRVTSMRCYTLSAGFFMCTHRICIILGLVGRAWGRTGNDVWDGV